MTSVPKLDNRISVGNVLTILSMLVLGAAAFFDVKGQVNANAEEIARIETSVEANTDAITALRIGEASESQKMASLQARVRRIDKKVDEILREVRMQRTPMPQAE